MKTAIITTAALIGALVLPSLAFSKTVLGCEVIDMGGYSNKADPTCQFAVIGNQHAQKLVDPDGIPANGDEFTVADTEKQD
jgi:hypothetical protein